LKRGVLALAARDAEPAADEPLIRRERVAARSSDEQRTDDESEDD
jgi:hypothetical protein